jgi:hypothetical protein
VSVVLAGLIIVGLVAAVAMFAAMLYRDEPRLGMLGLFTLMIAGVVAAVYSVVFTG